MLRILFAEDNAYASELSENIRSKAHTVDLVKNLCDAEYKITSDPGADAYDMLFLDLDMPIGDLPKELQSEAKKSFAGWVFYRHILVPYPKLQKNTVFFTAFENRLEEIIGTPVFKSLNILSKRSPDLVSRTNAIINKLS